MTLPFTLRPGYRIKCNVSGKSFTLERLLEENDHGECIELIYSCRNSASNLRFLFYTDDMYEELYEFTDKSERILGTDFTVYNGVERIFSTN